MRPVLFGDGYRETACRNFCLPALSENGIYAGSLDVSGRVIHCIFEQKIDRIVNCYKKIGK